MSFRNNPDFISDRRQIKYKKEANVYITLYCRLWPLCQITASICIYYITVYAKLQYLFLKIAINNYKKYIAY